MLFSCGVCWMKWYICPFIFVVKTFLNFDKNSRLMKGQFVLWLIYPFWITWSTVQWSHFIISYETFLEWYQIQDCYLVVKSKCFDEIRPSAMYVAHIPFPVINYQDIMIYTMSRFISVDWNWSWCVKMGQKEHARCTFELNRSKQNFHFWKIYT